VRERVRFFIGWELILLGSILGIVGGVANAFAWHDMAINFWVISNMFLFLWALGYIRGYWNTKVSIEALVVMYAIYEIQNVYAIIMR
jgi:phage shock protein PspC (stress-responsive transcriptional regulator)